MDKIAPTLYDCAVTLTAPKFVSDLRFSACLYHSLNGSEYSFVQTKPRSHAGNPEESTPRDWHIGPIFSYHQVLDEMVFDLWNATASVWTGTDGIDRIVDWSSLTMMYQSIPIGSQDRLVSLMFGYRLWSDDWDNTTCCKAVTQIEPVFPDGDPDDPVFCRQEFEGDLWLEYVCDPRLVPGEIFFDSFLDAGRDGARLRVRCPEIGRFFVNHPADQIPRNITDESELVL
jgi:hypothetical protein